MPASGRPWVRGATAIALVVTIAMAVRVWPARDVFTASGIQLVGDGDAVYHLWRAQQTAADWPHAPWFDPALNHPHGVRIPWPPLFDELIATAARGTPGGAAPEHVARVAAVMPVALAAVTVLVVALLASAVWPGIGLAAALVASTLPASVYYSYVGLTDHHVAELLLFSLALLAYVLAWRTNRLRSGAVAALGVALTLSFWNWLGSALYLVFIAGHAALNHLVEPEGREAAGRVDLAAAAGTALAALLLLVSIVLLGAPGSLSSLAVEGVGALAVVLSAAVALFFAIAWLLARTGPWARRPAVRLLELVAALALTGAALLAVPAIRTGVATGLALVHAPNTLYESIAELRPALFSGRATLPGEALTLVALFGVGSLFWPFGGVCLARAWREKEGRQRVLFLAFWGAAFLALTAARMRFMLYLSVPLACWCAVGLDRLHARAAARLRWPVEGGPGRAAFLLAGCVLLVGPAYGFVEGPGPAVEPTLASTVGWLRAHAATRPGSHGVLAPWHFGHALRMAGLPVVSSNFGPEGGVGSIEDEATFYCATSEEDVDAVLSRRSLAFVIVSQPLPFTASVQGYRAVAGAAEPVIVTSSVWKGRTFWPGPRFKDSAMARLFFGDGMVPRGSDAPAFGQLRLLHEELPPPRGTDPEQIKVFGVVRGAQLDVVDAPAGVPVTVETELRTGSGRTTRWQTHAIAAAHGAVVRVPFATGANGDVTASAYQVSAGSRSTSLTVTERQVSMGERLAVRFEGRESPR